MEGGLHSTDSTVRRISRAWRPTTFTTV